MKINYCGKTDVGLRRANNEDAYLARPDLGFFTVADGMGGAASGEVASRIFIDTAQNVFVQRLPQTESETYAVVQEVFRHGNEQILAEAAANPSHQGMGCTAELVAFFDDSYIVAHVGDSRTYLFRDGKLRQITQDHSLVQDQLDKGLITEEEARKHSLRNIILRALGIQPSIELDVTRGKCLPEDIFLLCSDGLTDMVEDSAICEVLGSANNLADKVEQLIECAKKAGGNDNITVILCQVLSP